jgi:FMN reductase
MTRELKVLALVGNPKVGSRTLEVAHEISGQIVKKLEEKGARVQSEFVDLAILGAGLLDWECKDVADVVAQVLAADLLIVATPTYKATYTGLLKLFLDRIQQDALIGRTAIPVMVAATPLHGLAGETHLRPLLVELGAACPTRAIFVLESQLAELPVTISKWLAKAEPSLMASLSILSR